MLEQNFWQKIKDSLKKKNAHNNLFHMWFDPTQLIEIKKELNSHRFRLGVPSELHKYWISENLLNLISEEISMIYKKPFYLELIVTNSLKESSKDPSLPLSTKNYQQNQLNLSYVQAHTGAKVLANPNRFQQFTQDKTQRGSLNPDYTFSTFVVGRNNEFAHAGSFSIAEQPGKDSYNPLFIYGPTGMGKTHLLHAVGNHISTSQPHLRVNYASAEKFINECISSIRRREMDKFRLKYRERSDILLMDDVQVLRHGEAVQEEFFHTLNHFFDKKQQVVIASDRMPKDIRGLEDRIRTRLEWGLIADIQMPDIETRVAILKYKAELMKLNIPPEAISYIGRISKRSIRELEGNLNKVRIYSELQGLHLNLELAKKVLATHDDATHITISEIQKICARHFEISVSDLKSKSRTKPLVVARQSAMFMIKKHLDKSLVEIGRAFGKDHTTVINSLRRIESQLGKDSDLKKDIDEIEMRIHNLTGV